MYLISVESLEQCVRVQSTPKPGDSLKFSRIGPSGRALLDSRLK